MSKIKLLTIVLGLLVSTLTTPAVQANEPSTYTVYLPLVVKTVGPRWQIAAGPSDGIWSNLAIRVWKPAGGDLEVVVRNDSRTGNAGQSISYATGEGVCYWRPDIWAHECHWPLRDNRRREAIAIYKYSGQGPVTIEFWWNGELYTKEEAWVPGCDPKPDPLPPVPLACEMHADAESLSPGQTWIDLTCSWGWWPEAEVYEVTLKVSQRELPESAWVGAEPQPTTLTEAEIKWIDPSRPVVGRLVYFRGKLEVSEADLGKALWIGAYVDHAAGVKHLASRTYQVTQ